MFKFIGNMLKNIGRAVVSAAKKVSGFVSRAFKKAKEAVNRVGKWLWNTRPVRWLWNSTPVKFIVKHVSAAWTWVWSVAKGPVGWILGPVLAILFAPGLLATVMFTGLLVVAGISVYIWYLWNKAGQPDDVLKPLFGVGVGYGDPEPTYLETYEIRYDYLEDQILKAESHANEIGICENFARIQVLSIRRGVVKGIRSNAKIKDILHWVDMAARVADKDINWRYDVLHESAVSEDKRLDRVAQLKREHKEAEEAAIKATLSGNLAPAL